MKLRNIDYDEYRDRHVEWGSLPHVINTEFNPRTLIDGAEGYIEYIGDRLGFDPNVNYNTYAITYDTKEGYIAWNKWVEMEIDGDKLFIRKIGKHPAELNDYRSEVYFRMWSD